jgi:adenylate kinase
MDEHIDERALGGCEVLFVGGLSGSGKTTLVQGFIKANPSFLHLSASAILRSIERPILELDENEALANQTALKSWLLQLSEAERPRAILDGHGVLVVRGRTLAVPSEFFKGLGLRKIALVMADPAVILQNRVWPMEFDSERSIKWLQEQEADALAGVANELRITLHQVKTGDAGRFSDIVYGRDSVTSR